jgi:Zn-dependent M28 family amino/carboxypeptidase
MRPTRLCMILALAALTLPGCASRLKEQPSTDIDDVAYDNHVRVLASDDFQGRKPGTAGEDRTVAYLVEQFRKLGLKPGNGKSYVQQVPLLQITAASDATLSVAGPRGSRSLAYGKDMMIWTKRALAQVHLTHSELVFVGFGIVAPEYNWNDYAGIDVHGKTVIVLANDPGYGSKDPVLFRGNSMSEYGRWDYKMEEAARQGAEGVLLIHDGDAVGFGWNVIQTTWSGAQFELANADKIAPHVSIEGWLQADAARGLFADAGQDLARLATAAGYPGFKAVPLGITADSALHNSLREFSSANVIAVLPGHKGHDYVLYTAHWDGLGMGLNGAVDNASGVAGLLVLAQSHILTKPAADRSIAFLATTAAQPSLLGSLYYAENPLIPLRQTAAVIDVDILLNTGPTRDVSIIGSGNSDLEESARAEALLRGRVTHPEFNPREGMYFRSDSYRFASHGVPALYLQAGVDSSARGPAWGRAQIEDYFAHRFRQAGDVYAPGFDVRGAVADLTLYYHIADRVARGRRYPRWYPNSEFRAARRGADKAPAGD